MTKIRLNVHSDARGSLGVSEFSEIPFEPKRFFWLFNVPEGASRAGHGHKSCKQFIFCQKGSVKLSITDLNLNSTQFELNMGESIHLDSFKWLDLLEFSRDAILGIFASEPYDRNEYIETFDDFIRLAES